MIDSFKKTKKKKKERLDDRRGRARGIETFSLNLSSDKSRPTKLMAH